ncbi:MAG: methyltransferase domain-containing protein [Bryobacteraceae bacterium]|nr:methyltransferase domain-containing protein [Bryobacteraceae bacterium]
MGPLPQGRSFNDLIAAMRGFQESRALLTAVELDIFAAIGEGATAEETAARIGAAPRSTGTLLNALVALGALAKRGERYFNTEVTTRHLTPGKPEYARPALMHTVNLWNTWSNLTESVRAGTAPGHREVGARDPRWIEAFIAAMHYYGRENAPAMLRAVGAEGASRLLDIGGGSGIYSIVFANANPDLRAEILDLPEVLPIAQRHIREAGLDGRISVRPGDLRQDEFGAGYHLVLLSAICHMLSPEENQDLLVRAHRAMLPGGRLVIREFILQPDRTGPRQAALFALNMLVGTAAGSAYSEDEYAAWLDNAGFRDLARPADDLLVARK